jgi:hypothetical protein
VLQLAEIVRRGQRSVEALDIDSVAYDQDLGATAPQVCGQGLCAGDHQVAAARELIHLPAQALAVHMAELVIAILVVEDGCRLAKRASQGCGAWQAEPGYPWSRKAQSSTREEHLTTQIGELGAAPEAPSGRDGQGPKHVKPRSDCPQLGTGFELFDDASPLMGIAGDHRTHRHSLDEEYVEVLGETDREVVA